jgi:hypothetical protein
MGGTRYETVRIADLERPDGWSPIRRHLAVRSFGISAWTAHEAGTTVIPEHDETPSGHEELYVVVAGRATFTVDGDEVEADGGTIVFVRDPEAKRAAVAAEAETTVLAVGAKPGEPYRPRSWETNVDLLPLFEEGRFEELKTRILEALDRYDDRGALLYNLACAEAQLGEADAALEHLAAALEDRPDFRENAATDTDLDPIRDDARFPH